MSFQRKLIRNQLKVLKQNNNIKKEWRNYQLEIKTIDQILNEKRKNKRKRK